MQIKKRRVLKKYCKLQLYSFDPRFRCNDIRLTFTILSMSNESARIDEVKSWIKGLQEDQRVRCLKRSRLQRRRFRCILSPCTAHVIVLYLSRLKWRSKVANRGYPSSSPHAPSLAETKGVKATPAGRGGLSAMDHYISWMADVGLPQISRLSWAWGMPALNQRHDKATNRTRKSEL